MYIAKTEDVLMLLMFFVVAVTNGVLTSKLKKQQKFMTEKERQSNALFNLLKDFSSAKDLNDILNKSVKHILDVFGFESVIFFPADGNKLSRTPHQASNFVPDEMEWLAAEICYKDKIESGNSTSIMQGASAKYFPIVINRSEIFIIGIKINDEIKSNKNRNGIFNVLLKRICPFCTKILFLL